MAYTTTTLIGNYLQRSLTANETSILTILIPAIKKFIDRYTSSTFDQASETTRYFEAVGGVVDIDPCTAITAVTLYDNDDAAGSPSDTYTDLDDYVAEPVNETVKTELVRRSGSWSPGLRRIGVTAKFSEYDTGVPEDIQAVATALAASVLNEGKSASTGGNVQSESLEGHSITYNTTQQNLNDIVESNGIIRGMLEQHRDLMVG